MHIVVVTRGGPIGVDVDETATIGGIRASAAVIIQRPVRALTFDESVLTDDSPLLPAHHILHEMRPSGWFVRRQALKRASPFHLAAAQGRHDCLDLLLQVCPEGALVQNKYGSTPFHHATAHNDHVSCLERLLHYHPQGAVVKDVIGLLPIHYAVMNGHAACLSLLLQRCPEGLMVENDIGNTPFHMAVRGGHSACLELLLQHCPEGTAMKDIAGRTPLDCVEEGDDDCRALLQRYLCQS